MHTTPDTTELTLRDLQQVMIRVQIKALETLERLMDDQELTGNEKVDKAKATERNRQRLSATQTLVHCRAVQRELRERRELAHRIRQDERQAAKKAPHELASLRRLHKLHPDEYDNPDRSFGGAMAQTESKTEGAGHADNGSPVKPPNYPNSSGATGGLPASAGPDQPEHHPDNTTSGCAADPSPRPSPARSMDGGEGAKPTPSPLGGVAGEGGERSQIDRRMRGRSESSDRSDNGTTLTPSHKLRPITERTLTTPPKPKRSRYKTRKPKRPKQPRRRKR